MRGIGNQTGDGAAPDKRVHGPFVRLTLLSEVPLPGREPPAHAPTTAPDSALTEESKEVRPALGGQRMNGQLWQGPRRKPLSPDSRRGHTQSTSTRVKSSATVPTAQARVFSRSRTATLSVQNARPAATAAFTRSTLKNSPAALVASTSPSE